MKNLLSRLWNDEQGFIVSTELIFLATIIVIGLLVGMVVWRDALVQELGDTGAAIGQFDQSYNVSVLDNPGKGIEVKAETVVVSRDFGCVQTEGSFNNFGYVDQTDVCDTQDVAGQPPATIDITQPPQDESS